MKEKKTGKKKKMIQKITEEGNQRTDEREKASDPDKENGQQNRIEKAKI